jgi:hypothetical protein
MPSATIKLFLIHGDPKRLRTAEISNWSGKAVSAPRTEFEDFLARDELGQSGVYILTGADPLTGDSRAYVGEAEVLRDRLKSHKSLDFWVQATAFVSKDENLTKSHIRYLEGRLIERSLAASRTKLTNAQSSGAKLPESDREDMEVFLGKVQQLLPVLGSDILTPIVKPNVAGQSIALLYCDIKGLRATGERTLDGFVVFKGSQAVPDLRPSAGKYPYLGALREKLLKEGALQPNGSALVFTKNVQFSSPSAAAVVVHGGSANGLIAWRTQDGTTLKDFESSTT